MKLKETFVQVDEEVLVDMLGQAKKNTRISYWYKLSPWHSDMAEVTYTKYWDGRWYGEDTSHDGKRYASLPSESLAGLITNQMEHDYVKSFTIESY